MLIVKCGCGCGKVTNVEKDDFMYGPLPGHLPVEVIDGDSTYTGTVAEVKNKLRKPAFVLHGKSGSTKEVDCVEMLMIAEAAPLSSLTVGIYGSDEPPQKVHCLLLIMMAKQAIEEQANDKECAK